MLRRMEKPASAPPATTTVTWIPASTPPKEGIYILHYEVDAQSPKSIHSRDHREYVQQVNFEHGAWCFDLDVDTPMEPISESGLRAIQYCEIPRPPGVK